MKRNYITISILFLLSFGILASFTNIEESKYLNLNGDDKTTKDTTDASLAFTVRTTSYGGNYAPKHVLAIWIKDGVGNFVKSLKVRANSRKKHLVKWVASSNYNEVDAVTGATINSHTTHTVIWDCKDVAGNIVPDDDYQIWVEYTSENSNNNGNPGPSNSIPFTKGNTSQIFSPPTQQYFKDMVVEYQPTGVSIPEKDGGLSEINIFPNPVVDYAVISLYLEKDIITSIEVIDVNGKLVDTILKEQLLNAGKNEFLWNIRDSQGRQLSHGIYNIIFLTENSKLSRKVIISR